MQIYLKVFEVLAPLIEFGVNSVLSFSVCIRSYPLLLAFVVLSVVGLGIGLIKRIIRL